MNLKVKLFFCRIINKVDGFALDNFLSLFLIVNVFIEQTVFDERECEVDIEIDTVIL